MKYLGIDYGAKRVGVAVSDQSESFAMPVSVLSNSENLLSKIEKICMEQKVDSIVVGESKDFSQKENDIMEEIKIFVKSLEEKIDLPVQMHPEFLTSLEAEQIQGKNDMHDASAAAIILKSYLDKLKNNGK